MNTDEATLHVQLLGRWTVFEQGQAVTIPVRKDRWLLALLLLANGRASLRQDLVDALWPQGASDPAYYLRRSLSHLRAALPRHAHRFESVTRQDVRFDPAGVFVDALAFEQGALSGDPARWREAISLYAGPLLPDCHETWVLAPRQRLHRLYQERVVRLGDAALASGEVADLEPMLLKALEIDPLWEEGRRLWMRALAAQGQPHDAIKTFQELQRLLQHESPPHRPEPETEALAQQIRNQARRPTPRPPATRPVAPPPSNLPEPVTRFIGREREVERGVELLGQTRLLTLTGAGGCGKTRLSQEIARAALDDFADGVWWVELAPVTDPALVLRTVAEALDIKETPGEPLVAAVVSHLKARGLLLVLDNCEHVLDAAAALIESLLRACPGVKVLTSSREALNGAGETAFRVPSLTAPEPDFAGSWESLQAFESVRLFVERARAAKPELVFTDAHTATVASICRRLDGIPLAIELAAARVRSMTLPEIERRLDDRFAVLTGGSRTAPARHQTLHALIDWSYQLLTPEEQVLLQRLSVFAGGWTLDAAEAVCAGDGVDASRVLDLLVALVDRNLVAAAADADSTRYRMLETIRQFAEARLRESGEEVVVQDRHADFYAARTAAQARAVEENWKTAEGKDHSVWAAWYGALERDIDNLRVALLYAERRPILRLSLAVELIPFWNWNHMVEGRQYLVAAADGCDIAEQASARWYAYVSASMIALAHIDYASALCYQSAGLAIQRAVGDRRGEAHGLNTLAFLTLWIDGYDAACALSKQARAIFEELCDVQGVLACLGNLCEFAIRFRHFDTVRATISEAQRLASKADWGQGYETTLAYEAGDWETVHAVYQRNLEVAVSGGGLYFIGQAKRALGEVLREMGDYPAARALLQESLRIHWERQELDAVGGCLEELAALFLLQGGTCDSARLWGATAGLSQRLKKTLFPLWEVRIARRMAAAKAALGEDAFVAAWEDGRAMALDDAIALALR